MRAKRLLAITAAIAAVLVLAACSGKTTGASNLTNSSARLNAVGSCDQSCTAYMRWRVVGTSTWTNAPSFNVGNKVSNVPWYQDATGLASGTQYEYQACGKETSYSGFVCVGPDGQTSSTQQFSTTMAGPPVNTAAPAISGTIQEGQTLTADQGSWSGSQPITFADRWQRCTGGGGSCADLSGAAGTTYRPGLADVGFALKVVVTASNGAGSSAAASAATSPVAQTNDPAISTAGDIACDPTDPNYNNGNGTANACRQLATSNLLVGTGLAAVLPLGDTQYQDASLAQFGAVYAPTWGRVNPIVHPAIGNHEYQTPNASGYFDYFNGVGQQTGKAGDRATGYYSFDLGTWHLIALNSNCSIVSCSASSPQEAWLRSDLGGHSAACTVAYWHHPLFNSGIAGNATNMRPIFQDLYNANSDLVLSGHDHHYERFAPQNPSGQADGSRGIREIIVGTGGNSLFDPPAQSPQPDSEVRDYNTFGVLELALHPTSYDWLFIPASGGAFTDSGTQSCH